MIVVRQTIPTPDPDMGEVFRYMGVKGEPDEGTIKLANEAVEKIKSSAVCRVCYSRIPIERPKEYYSYWKNKNGKCLLGEKPKRLR